MVKLLTFVAANLGKADIGDTPENKGQCVGIVEAWLDANGKEHVWGNAADLLSNADRTVYTVVSNRPYNYPPPGSVVCWDTTWGGGAGHTAIVIAANQHRLAVLEQNNPLGAACLIATHSYAGVLGWLMF